MISKFIMVNSMPIQPIIVHSIDNDPMSFYPFVAAVVATNVHYLVLLNPKSITAPWSVTTLATIQELSLRQIAIGFRNSHANFSDSVSGQESSRYCGPNRNGSVNKS